MGEAGVGGVTWRADAALGLSVWVTAAPPGSHEPGHAGGHASGGGSRSATPPPTPPPRGVPGTERPAASVSPAEAEAEVEAAPPLAVGHAAIYKQYADATGHAPLLRSEALLFWQSRNRYKSSAIALHVADRYKQLGLPVGVLVVDYENERVDGDFAPNPSCFPSVGNLSRAVRSTLNATTMFSFWPVV